MDITLRPVTEAEFPDFCRADWTAFGFIPSDDDVTRWGDGLELDRTLAAFEGDTIVGTAGAFSFDVTVPGFEQVRAAGVTVVGVLPTHRRRGVLSRMMAHQLDDVADREEPLAVLLASEGAIYGRFGYGTATFSSTWSLPTEATDIAVPPKVDGRLRLLELKDARAVVPDVYERARRRSVGEVTRGGAKWDRYFDEKRSEDHDPRFFTLVHESGAGDVDGFAVYRVKEAMTAGRAANSLKVLDLYSVDAEVDAALWQFLLSIDLLGTVSAAHRPVDEPLRFRLADPRRLHVTAIADHLWVRVVDPAGALAARRYAVADRIAIELNDPFLPSNDGTWVVEGSPDGAEAARARTGADLAMSARDLGSLYLGGVSATTLARAGRITELTDGATARADRFFGTAPAPWCGSDF